MKRQKFTKMFLALIFGLAIVAISTPKVEPAEKTVASVVLKYSEQPGSTGLRPSCVKEFCRLVDDRTNGKVKVEVYWAESLVKAKENVRAVSTGVVDMGYTTYSYNPSELAPYAYVESIAFLFASPVDLTKIQWQMYDQFEALRSNYLKWNQIPVMLWCYDPFELQTRDKPIRKLEDFKGKKLRVSGAGHAITLKAAGAVGVAMTGAETYEAVQRGTVDGAILPLEAAVTYGMPQICKYVTFVNFAPPGQGIITINKSKLESLPTDIQKIILDTGREISFKFAEIVMGTREKTLAEFTNKGCEVIKFPPADLQKWQRLPEVMGLADEKKKFLNERGYPGDALVDAFLAKLREYTK